MNNLMIFYRILNVYLKVRFNLFGKYLKKVSFSNRKLMFFSDFKTLDGFSVLDNDFFSNHEVWFSKDNVELTNDGLSLKCYSELTEHTNWEGTYESKYTSGGIETRDTFLMSNGIWVINACMCDSFCAVWLLKKDRNEPGYVRSQITPEIDIMENVKGRMKQTIHWGYAEEPVYRKYGIGSSIFRSDNKFHEYAVEFLKNGYKFYVDGILTSIFRTENSEFVTDYPNFLILNNAMNKYSKNKEYTIFKVKSIKVYQ